MTYQCRRSKAQSAFEFIFIFGALLGVMITGLWFSWSRNIETEREIYRLEIDSLLVNAAEKINTVWLEGEGFSTNITLPQKLANLDYDINVSSNYLYLIIGGELYMRAIITQNVTGALVPGAVNRLANKKDHISVTIA